MFKHKGIRLINVLLHNNYCYKYKLGTQVKFKDQMDKMTLIMTGSQFAMSKIIVDVVIKKSKFVTLLLE